MKAQQKLKHCTDHPDREATAYCSRCENFLCEECENKHMSRFEFMSHKTCVTHDFETNNENSVLDDAGCNCGKHPGNPLAFVCKRHWVLCCSECKEDSRAHQGCTVVPIEKVDAKIVNKRHERVKREYMERTEKAKEMPLERLRQREEDFNSEADRVTKEITSYFTKLREAIDQREKELLDKVEAARSENSIGSILRELDDESSSNFDETDSSEYSEELKKRKLVLETGRALGKTKTLEKVFGKAVSLLFETLSLSFVPSEAVGETLSSADVKVEKKVTGSDAIATDVTVNEVSLSWTPVSLEDVTYQLSMKKKNKHKASFPLQWS